MQPGFALVLFLQAARALGRNALRSVLTTLGIAIGVAAVALVVEVGNAGSAKALAALQNLGDNLVWIEAGGRNVNGVRTGSHGTTSLTLDDERAIERQVPGIRVCSPSLDGHEQIIAGATNWQTHWRGEAPAYLSIKKWGLTAGHAFSDDDVEHVASKVLIGETVRQRLFGARTGVGEVVRIAGHLFTVEGVLEAKGQTPWGWDQDDWFLLPYTTAMRVLRPRGTPDYLDDILCSARSSDVVDRSLDAIAAMLRERHHIERGEEDDFNIRRPDEFRKAQVEASRTLALLLLSVAAISLVVGGIGIMNVMLVSVAQRTREIGLRLAVGATERDVQLQFLGESVLLSLAGGVLGIAISAAGSKLFERVVHWPLATSLGGLGLALASSLAVGVVFGFYPAWRASKLEPIDALRHE